MLPERGKLQRGPNVVSSDLGEVGHDLVTAHARGQVLEHVVHRDPRPNEARLPAAHVRTHIDQRHRIHEVDRSSEDGLGARSVADCGFRYLRVTMSGPAVLHWL